MSRRGTCASLAAVLLGTNAAKMALGLGAKVTLLDNNLNRLRELDDIFSGRVFTVASNSYNVERAAMEADLLIGGVLIPGAAAPKIVTKGMVAKMKKGSVIVDVAIDQGGCIETAHPTTHSDPSYEVSGVVHYCVTNMPAAVPNTSTLALTNATFPYVLRLANQGRAGSDPDDPGIAEGVNTYKGELTYAAVAQAQKRDWKPVGTLLLGRNEIRQRVPRPIIFARKGFAHGHRPDPPQAPHSGARCLVSHSPGRARDTQRLQQPVPEPFHDPRNHLLYGVVCRCLSVVCRRTHSSLA